ncbi:hypothetical protein [Candidatus Chloroploca sp. Khr17]|uniref:hypothetical protein n=1 Tax=Candidatus Chloroploca sp. Khr17 TaxID=2496869 RepID=UPI00101D96C0|nr:hypothetical protein [Candidatus Chloroploca sp. Khr17]
MTSNRRRFRSRALRVAVVVVGLVGLVSLVSLVGGALIGFHRWDALQRIPATGLVMLVTTSVGSLGIGWWRHRTRVVLPSPPWRATRPTALRLARWQVRGLAVRAHLMAPPPRPAQPPRPAALPQEPPHHRAAAVPRRLARPRVRGPRLTLDLEFITPAPVRPALGQVQPAPPEVTTLVMTTVAQVTAHPPALLAVHDQPRHLVFQLALTPVLTTSQQRAVIQALQGHGVRARWRDVATLSVLRASVRAAALPAVSAAAAAVWRWLPVVRTRQGPIWWPLPCHQHLVLAGAMHGPLLGLLAGRAQVPGAHHPAVFVHDPDGRLRELHPSLAALVPQPEALAQARDAQLRQRFARARGHVATLAPPPLVLVMTPSATIWPDLQPLLVPEPGVQVILILGDRPPLAALRAACHRLPVIEVPDPPYPALPDAFRPAGLPVVNVGQAIAWLPGGQTVWRGLPLLVEPALRQNDAAEGQ